MKVLGDIHGGFNRLAKIMKAAGDDVLCVGDVGIGFPKTGMTPKFAKNFWAIRGNHDNPEAARDHPQFLPDYGMWNGIFLLAGARSVDRFRRTENIDWWADEELSYGDLQRALDLYAEEKPRVVVSHDAPFSLQYEIKIAAVAKHPGVAMYGEPKPYATTVAMDQMLEIHRPELWLFGHWHVPWMKEVDGTLFRCVDCFELVDVPDEFLS